MFKVVSLPRRQDRENYSFVGLNSMGSCLFSVSKSAVTITGSFANCEKPSTGVDLDWNKVSPVLRKNTWIFASTSSCTVLYPSTLDALHCLLEAVTTETISLPLVPADMVTAHIFKSNLRLSEATFDTKHGWKSTVPPPCSLLFPVEVLEPILSSAKSAKRTASGVLHASKDIQLLSRFLCNKSVSRTGCVKVSKDEKKLLDVLKTSIAEEPAVETVESNFVSDLPKRLMQEWLDRENVQNENRKKRKLYIDDKKTGQVSWMVEMLRRKELHQDTILVDIGCGRGDLLLSACMELSLDGIGVDINTSSLDQAEMAAQSLGIHASDIASKRVCEKKSSVKFCEADITGEGIYSWFRELNRPLVFIGLHTCGELSDSILIIASTLRSGALLVPCCYTKHTGLSDTVFRVLKQNEEPSKYYQLDCSTISKLCEKDQWEGSKAVRELFLMLKSKELKNGKLLSNGGNCFKVPAKPVKCELVKFSDRFSSRAICYNISFSS